jgi:hypothetical protein
MPPFFRALHRPVVLLRMGVLLFLVARLWQVWLGAFTGPFPRNGADALTYLWRGEYMMAGFDHELPAVRDLIDQTTEAGQVVKDPSDWQYFTNLRILGSMSPVHDVIVCAFIKTGLSLRFVYAAVETVDVLVMTWAFALIGLRLVGPRGAGIAMVLLAFMDLPRQGIATFIPSTLCCSLAVLLWAVLLERPWRPRWWQVLVLAPLITLCHPVGQAHLAGAGLLYFLLMCQHAGSWKDKALRLAAMAGVFFVAVCLPYAAYVIWPQLRPTEQGLDFDFIGGVKKNASYAIKMVWNVLRWNPLFAVLLVSALFGAWRLPRRCRAAALAALVLLLISMVHVLTGFPAETFSRVLVILAVVCAGIAGRFFISGLRPPFWRGAAALGALGTAIWFFVPYSFNDAHYNTILVNVERLRDRLALEDKAKPIVYLDAATAFQSALMAGGAEHHALVVNNYKDRARAIAHMSETEPQLLLLPPPKALNSVAMIRPLSPQVKRSGFCLPFVEQVEVESADGKPLNSVWVRFENDGAGFDLTVFWRDRQMRSVLAVVPVPAKQQGWMELRAPAEHSAATQLVMTTPRKDAWITGVAAKPTETTRWPWGEAWIVSYYPRYAPGPLAYRLRFDWPAVFAEQGMEAVLPLLAEGLKIESDDTGLLMLRGTRRKPNSQP